MARSRKKTPITGTTTAPSDKEDKARANRRLRSLEKQALERGEDLPAARKIENRDGFSKDGKAWRGFDDPKLRRK